MGLIAVSRGERRNILSRKSCIFTCPRRPEMRISVAFFFCIAVMFAMGACCFGRRRSHLRTVHRPDRRPAALVLPDHGGTDWAIRRFVRTSSSTGPRLTGCMACAATIWPGSEKTVPCATAFGMRISKKCAGWMYASKLG